MGNASLSKFAIGRVVQSDKDTPNVTEMVRYPIMYGGGFDVTPEVDNYTDLVETQFESSRTDILSATVRGSVGALATADFLALHLASILGSVISTNIGSGMTFTAATTDICTISAGHAFVTGQRVKVSSSSVLPAGLSSSVVYYAGVISSTTFKLYTTLSDAISGSNAVDITDAGTGTHTLTPEVYTHTITPNSTATPNFHTILFHDGTCDRRIIGAVPINTSFGADYQDKRMNCGVDYTAIRREWNDATPTGTFTAATTDICTLAAHGFRLAEAVRVSNSGGALPTGLSAATTYYVKPIDSGTFYLYDTFVNAVAGGTQGRMDITGAGSGTNTVTAYSVSYPTQEPITPFHFTMTGASLSIQVEDAAAALFTDSWAGFQYQLSNVIAAEQRAGSNTYRVIQKVDREQGLTLMMDYSDATFKDIVQNYQTNNTPTKLKVIMKIRGRLMGQTNYFTIQGTFYRCYVGQHSYTADPNIGKQSVALSINHDEGAGKSCEWIITNDIDSYLT